MTTLAQLKAEEPSQAGDVSRTPLGEVTEPGAYVCFDTGDLIRVVRTHASSSEAELVDKHGDQPVLVTRVSEDPFVPISQARIAAANLDIEISF